MVKCACGCGQEVTGPVVGVPINDGSGEMVAFIPEHHQGMQTPVAADGCAENPLTKKETAQIQKLRDGYKRAKMGTPKKQAFVDGMVYAYATVIDDFGTKGKMIRGNPFNPSMFVKERREHPSFSSAQIRRIVRDHRGMKKRGHRRNVLPVGQIAKLAGVKGSVKVGIGENPGIIRCPECGGRGRFGKSYSYRLCGICDGEGKITPEKYARIALQRTPLKNADDGQIHVDGSPITEIRYVEKSSGIPYKHKLERPVKMRVRGGKVHIPKLSVAPEGITQ
jgi:hypothetical protein